MSNEQILIVDNDQNITGYITSLLSVAGFRIATAINGQTAISKVRKERPDLILLELNLPYVDGIEICKIIRHESQVPIIIISDRPEDYTESQCLDIGADDYIKKPFNSLRLLSRIRAILRRTINQSTHVNKIEINLEERAVSIGGKEIKLTKREFNVLYELFANQGKVIYYRDLLVNFWGEDYRDATTYIQDCIWSIRRKIEIDPTNPKYIINIPGIGYRFPSRSF